MRFKTIIDRFLGRYSFEEELIRLEKFMERNNIDSVEKLDIYLMVLSIINVIGIFTVSLIIFHYLF